MKKFIPVVMALVFSVGCSSVETIPNINEQGTVALAEGMDETEILASPFVYEGVSVGGVDMAGTNLETGQELLEAELGPKLEEEINLTYGENNYSYTIEDLGYSIDYKDLTKEALRIGRDGSDEGRLATIEDLKSNPVDIEVEMNANDETIAKEVSQIASDLYVEPIEAEYSFDADSESVVAENGQNGYKVSEGELIENIKTAVNDGNTSIEIPVEVTEVASDAQENAARVNGIIGDAESTFNAGFWPRAENVRVSTRYLDGVVIGPGETFAFNEFIGDTTADKGYQEAVVINEDNEQVPGMGGGVCQTSTALYQALLEAEVEIINRSPHTQLMPYSQPGLDAAIEYGSAELAFKNDYDFPILVRTYDDGAGWIRFEVWGDTNVKSHETTLFSEQLPNASDGGLMYSSYRRNEDTGEVTYLGDTYYPPVSTWQ